MAARTKIVFLQAPEGFRARAERLAAQTHGGFQFDCSVPLPLEIPEDETSVDMERISIETIVAGMLRVLVEGGTGAGNLLYYRRFILAARPDILHTLSGAAAMKAKNGDFEMAREVLDTLKALFPLSPEVALVNAVVLEDEADFLERNGREAEAESVFRQAETAYKRALSVDGSLLEALFNAGLFSKKRRNYAAAREYFLEYLAVAGDEEKKARALSLVRGIEKRGLDDEHFHRAYALIREGREEQGMAELRPFLEAHSEVWHGWFLLGWALRRLERWADGAAALRKALELGGKGADAHNELAICLMESGDDAGAKKELEAALALDGENIKIISNLAVLSLKTGDAAAADGFLRAVLELDPNDPLAKSCLARAP